MRNLEASLAKKQQALGLQREARLVSRLFDSLNDEPPSLPPKLPRPLKAGRAEASIPFL